MKPKTMILMVVAVVCGLGASYMTSRLLAERDDKPPEAPQIAKVALLVPKKNVALHTAIGLKPEDLFTEKQFVKDDVPKEALTQADLAKLKNKYMKRALRKNDYMMPDDFMDNPNGLTSLEQGKRAQGIVVKLNDIAGGFASLPGSRVDIIWTSREADGQLQSSILLENIPVLAADTQANPGENKGAMPASVVTVSLWPEEVLKVKAAEASGTLSLSLRNLDDATSSDVTTVKSGSLGKNNVKKEDPKNDREPLDKPAIATQTDRPDTAPRDPGAKPQDGVPAAKQIPAGWKKFTVTKINGDSRKQYLYWLDENDNIVRNPELDTDATPAPTAPAAKGKNDKKFAGDDN